MSTENIIIRPAKIEDVDAIAEIYNQGVDGGISTFDDFYVSVNRYKAYFDLNRKKSSLLVAVLENNIVGWASIDPISERNAYRFTSLGSVYVRNEFKGQQIGRLLKIAKLKDAVRLDYHSMICEILSTNHISVSLNLSLGFRIVGEISEAGYRNNNWIGLIVMQKFLKLHITEHSVPVHSIFVYQ